MTTRTRRKQRAYEDSMYTFLRLRYHERLWIPLAKHVEGLGKTWTYYNVEFPWEQEAST